MVSQLTYSVFLIGWHEYSKLYQDMVLIAFVLKIKSMGGIMMKPKRSYNNREEMKEFF